MTRLEKCELLKSKGYKYDPETGKIYGMYGKEIKCKNNRGYIRLNHDLLGHHFAFFMIHNHVDFIELDHRNRIRHDNRISNLEISNRSEQGQNRSGVKGYSWDSKNNKWMCRIKINNKSIFLGNFNTEEEAREIYLKAKKKYHLITK